MFLKKGWGRKPAGRCMNCVVLCGICHVIILVRVFRYPLFTYQSQVEESWTLHPNRYYGGTLDRTNDSKALESRWCPAVPPSFEKTATLVLKESPPALEAIQTDNPAVLRGGRWLPSECQARQKVAIIIPYRDRFHHLLYLLDRLHPMLQRQQCHYRIFVSEQVSSGPFNKGRVMNLAYRTASVLDDWDCYIFHDVDLLPEVDLNLYRCADRPLHLSAGVDQLRYTLMYEELVGGVLALSKQHYEAVNGYSNNFWGWGGEDDNMNRRIKMAGMTVLHTSTQRGRYKMMPHVKGKPSLHRVDLMSAPNNLVNDGFSNLSDIDARVLSIHDEALYTNITVDAGTPPHLRGPASKSSWWDWLKVEIKIIVEGF